MAAYLSYLIKNYLYLAIFVSVFGQEISIPVPLPNEILLTFAGYQIAEKNVNFFLVLLVALAADILGASLFYWLALKLGRPAILKYGKFLISERRLNQVEKKINNKFDIFLGRTIPFVRIYASAAAGILKINYRQFITYSSLGTITWSSFFIFAGLILNKSWQNLANFFYLIDSFVVFILILLIIIFISLVYRYRQRRKKRENTTRH